MAEDECPRCSKWAWIRRRPGRVEVFCDRCGVFALVEGVRDFNGY